MMRSMLALTLGWLLALPALAWQDPPAEGPHKGALAEWGTGEYRCEIVFNEKTTEATVYILDGAAKQAKPIAATEIVVALKRKQPVTVKLKAVPQAGDAQGTASKFVGKDAVFAKHESFKGTIGAAVVGKAYSGSFAAKHKHSH